MCGMKIDALGKAWQRWHYRLRSLEWPARMGSGLLLVSAVLAFTVLAPARQQLAQTERTLAEQRRIATMHPARMDRSPEAMLAAFYRFLPQEDSLLEQVAEVLQIAEENGIAMDKIEYAVMPDPGSRLRRYQMTMPLRGTYPDLRYFMIDVMNRMPAVAISELGFRREDVHGDEVESRIRLTFYLGRAA